MKKIERYIFCLVLLIFVACTCYSRQSTCAQVLEDANTAYKAKNQQALASLLSQNQQTECEASLFLLVGRGLGRQGFYDSARVFIKEALQKSKGDNTLLGDAQYWLGRNLRAARVYDEALAAFLLSLETFEKTEFPNKYARSLNAIANLYDEQGNTDKALIYRRDYLSQLEGGGDSRKLTIAYINLASTMINLDPVESKDIFRKALNSLDINEYADLKAIIHQNLGVLYTEKLKGYDSALYHYKEARILYEILEESVVDLDINIGALMEYQGDFKEARIRYLKVLQQIELLDDLAYDHVIYGNLAEVNEKLGRYKEAYQYEKLRAEASQLLLNEEKNKAIVEAETRYKTAVQEKLIVTLERDKTEAEIKREKAARVAWIVGLSLLPIGLLVFFLIRNYKTARLIAEQQSQLDKQRVLELVRQQEQIGFDAMVLGQSNERKRLAEALHDHLGSLMATLRLRFESFWLHSAQKDGIDEQSYICMVDQIDEACDEIRRVSHDTRSGILISEGLLTAIEELATNINDSGNMNIEVNGYGLGTGLDGTIELSIYRIVQELLTNIIKHAEAVVAYVQLTMHEGSLNILVEDEGKGFDPAELSNGVGLKSIRSRVNYLKGDMLIDSRAGRGTTINLNIPLDL